MQLDLESGILKVSDIRVKKVHSLLPDLMGSRRSSARKLASLAGSLQSMSTVQGPVSLANQSHVLFYRKSLFMVCL